MMHKHACHGTYKACDIKGYGLKQKLVFPVLPRIKSSRFSSLITSTLHSLVIATLQFINFSKTNSSRLTSLITSTIQFTLQFISHCITMAIAASTSYEDICRILNSTQLTVRWCRTKSLLPTSRDCACGCDCRIVTCPRYPEGEFFKEGTRTKWYHLLASLTWTVETFSSGVGDFIRIIHAW